MLIFFTGQQWFCFINTLKNPETAVLSLKTNFANSARNRYSEALRQSDLELTAADLTCAQRKVCPPRKFHGEMTQMIGVDGRARARRECG